MVAGTLAGSRLGGVSSGMTLREKQNALVTRFSIIEDSHERMSAIVARGQKWPGVPDEERTDVRLVRGCVSRVWLVCEVADGVAHFRMSADSPLVQGLAALLCELYDGGTPVEIAEVEPDLLEMLGLARQLSPTRLNGLANVRRTMREFAAVQLA